MVNKNREEKGQKRRHSQHRPMGRRWRRLGLGFAKGMECLSPTLFYLTRHFFVKYIRNFSFSHFHNTSKPCLSFHTVTSHTFVPPQYPPCFKQILLHNMETFLFVKEVHDCSNFSFSLLVFVST
jgi:hypothetical protein